MSFACPHHNDNSRRANQPIPSSWHFSLPNSDGILRDINFGDSAADDATVFVCNGRPDGQSQSSPDVSIL